MFMAQINWPERYRPENCAVHVVNELAMDAPPQAALGNKRGKENVFLFLSKKRRTARI